VAAGPISPIGPIGPIGLIRRSDSSWTISPREGGSANAVTSVAWPVLRIFDDSDLFTDRGKQILDSLAVGEVDHESR
jgi:hypothetical protein